MCNNPICSYLTILWIKSYTENVLLIIMSPEFCILPLCDHRDLSSIFQAVSAVISMFLVCHDCIHIESSLFFLSCPRSSLSMSKNFGGPHCYHHWQRPLWKSQWGARAGPHSKQKWGTVPLLGQVTLAYTWENIMKVLIMNRQFMEEEKQMANKNKNGCSLKIRNVNIKTSMISVLIIGNNQKT